MTPRRRQDAFTRHNPDDSRGKPTRACNFALITAISSMPFCRPMTGYTSHVDSSPTQRLQRLTRIRRRGVVMFQHRTNELRPTQRSTARRTPTKRHRRRFKSSSFKRARPLAVVCVCSHPRSPQLRPKGGSRSICRLLGQLKRQLH